jgi:signal transduction histidine kinase
VIPDSAPASRGVHLRRRLLAIALAGMLPLGLVAAAGLYYLAVSQEILAERRNLEVTRLAATAVEAELNRSIAVLETLSLSPLLDGQSPRLDEFAELIQRIIPIMPHWSAVQLLTADGQVLQRISQRTVEPSGTLADLSSFERARQLRLPIIGDLSTGMGGEWGIPLHVPALRGEGSRFVLTAELKPSAINQVISSGRLPEGWYITVLDSNGVRVARSYLHEQTVGQRPSAELVRLMENSTGAESFGPSRTVEGAPVYTAVVRLRSAPGWMVASGMPASQVEDAVTRSVVLWGGGFFISLIMAITAALIAGRRISAPMTKLREAAQAIGNRQVPAPSCSNIIEIREVGEALVLAGRGRLESEAERDRMLDHLAEAQGHLSRQVEDLKLLQMASSELLRMPDLDAQLTAILQVLCRLHGTEFGMIVLSERGGPLRTRVVAGFPGLPRVSPNEADLAFAAELVGGQRLIIADLHADRRFPDLGELGCLGPFRSAHSTPVRSSDGSAIGAMIVLSQVTGQPDPWQIYLSDLCAGLASVYLDRADIQQVSEVSQQRLRVALESSSAPFCILVAVRDQSGAIVDFCCEFINPRGATMLQRPLSELGGILVAEILGDWQSSRLFQTLVSIVGQNESRELDLHSASQETPRWTHVIATSFGERVAVWFPDITERKQQEQVIRDADRRKDEFLATLAHELRNPLAPIRMAASLFGSPRATEEQKQRSQHIIQRQVSHMAMLLDDLFDISRITLGKLTVRAEPLDLREVAQAALETARPRIEARGHAVSIQLPSDPLPIQGDAMRLEQVVTNLLTNAAKFTPEGGALRVACFIENDQACLSVEDNGVGIAPGMLGTIFEKFAQAPAQRGVVANGLGIGLALARELARLHGGDVCATSQGPGAGSCFTLRLPLRHELPVAEAVPATTPPTTTPLKVLVADDNRDIAETLVAMLRLEGHEVVSASDGQEALSLYATFEPDVMVLDIGMPRLRGDELARTIRARPDGGRVRLIAMTGWGQPSDRQMTLAAGFDRHLTKPVDPTILLEALRC